MHHSLNVLQKLLMIDDAEDLDLVVPMYNLLEYNSNRSDTTVYGFIWKMKHLILIILKPMMLVNFKYKVKLLGKTEPDGANEILWNSNCCAV